jgi:tRNA(fMet)-specific endonuclease VapC
MIAFDTDILTEILARNPKYILRLAGIPLEERSAPIITIDEILSGRLGYIRKSEAKNARISIARACFLFEETLKGLRDLNLNFLSFTDEAESLFKEWRKNKIRGAPHDLRIAASCVVHSATLVSRNRRDFEGIPGLSTDFWP